MIRHTIAMALLGLAACEFTPPLGTDAAGPGRPDAGRDSAPGEPDAPNPIADADDTCPADYVVLGTSPTRYRVVDPTLSYLEAAADCDDDDDDGGFTAFTHLAVIGSEAERLAIVPSFTGNRWVGLTDAAVDGVYLWVTAEPTAGYEIPGNLPTPWDSGEPNGGAAFSCVRFKNSKLFDDRACEETNKYLCECDQFPPL